MGSDSLGNQPEVAKWQCMPPELKIDSLGAVRGLYARKGFFQVQLPDFPAMLRTHETLSRMPAMRLHERLYSPEMPTMPPEISARIIRGGVDAMKPRPQLKYCR
jgi:hypothetical protein